MQNHVCNGGVCPARALPVCELPSPNPPPCAQAFDELLLLRRGGQAIFFGRLGGPGAPALVSYLQAMPGVPPITQGWGRFGEGGLAAWSRLDRGATCAAQQEVADQPESQSRQWPPARTCSHQLICAASCRCFAPCRANPADWMMEVTSADAEAAAGTRFAEAYAASELRRWAFCAARAVLAGVFSAACSGVQALALKQPAQPGWQRHVHVQTGSHACSSPHPVPEVGMFAAPAQTVQPFKHYLLLHRSSEALVDQLSQLAGAGGRSPAAAEAASKQPGFWLQLGLLLLRNLRQYVRLKQYQMTRLYITVLVRHCWIFGTMQPCNMRGRWLAAVHPPGASTCGKCVHAPTVQPLTAYVPSNPQVGLLFGSLFWNKASPAGACTAVHLPSASLPDLQESAYAQHVVHPCWRGHLLTCPSSLPSRLQAALPGPTTTFSNIMFICGANYMGIIFFSRLNCLVRAVQSAGGAGGTAGGPRALHLVLTLDTAKQQCAAACAQQTPASQVVTYAICCIACRAQMVQEVIHVRR